MGLLAGWGSLILTVHLAFNFCPEPGASFRNQTVQILGCFLEPRTGFSVAPLRARVLCGGVALAAESARRPGGRVCGVGHLSPFPLSSAAEERGDVFLAVDYPGWRSFLADPGLLS